MKRTIICLSLAIKFSILFPQDSLSNQKSLPLSLSDAWSKALDHSKKIQLMTFETDIYKKEIQEAQFERLPEIQIKGHIEYATNFPQYTNGLFHKPEQHEVIHILYRLGVDSYIPLYHGNKLNLSIDKKKILYQISKEQKGFTVSEIKLQTAIYYLHLQRSILLKEIIIQNIANQEKQLEEIRNLLKNGVALKSDELRVQLNLSDQKLLLIQIENDITLANQKLNILIGLPDEQTVDPMEKVNPHQLVLESYEEYLSTAIHNSFEYHISEKQTALAKVKLQYVKANIRPRVGLYSDMWLANPQIFLYPYSPSNYTLGLYGVRASMPISELYINKPKTKIALLELEKEELAHHDIEDKIRQQVLEAYLRLKEALVRIEVARVNVDQATENERIVKNNYFNQATLITDLLDANIQSLKSSFQFVDTEIEVQIKYYQLLNILGIL